MLNIFVWTFLFNYVLTLNLPQLQTIYFFVFTFKLTCLILNQTGGAKTYMVEVMKGTSVMYEGNLLFKRDESFTLQRLKKNFLSILSLCNAAFTPKVIDAKQILVMSTLRCLFIF